MEIPGTYLTAAYLPLPTKLNIAMYSTILINKQHSKQKKADDRTSTELNYVVTSERPTVG